MSFETNQVNKVDTIVKYSNVIFVDGTTSTILKGVVGDYIFYPQIENVICNDVVGSYYYEVFSSYSKKLLQFTEQNQEITINRDLIVIPKTMIWTIAEKVLTINTDIKLFFKLKCLVSTNTWKEALLSSDFVNINGVYKYSISIENFGGIEIVDQEVPSILYVYTDDRYTCEIIQSPIEIEVNGSSSPIGD